MTVTAPDIRFGADGLAPAIVQDVADGTVLMLGWMDAEALDATIATGDVHFHSRSRDTLWRKGETSGNVLRLVDIATDCDADALLVTAEPTGPTCHRGTRTCFESSPAGSEPRPSIVVTGLLMEGVEPGGLLGAGSFSVEGAEDGGHSYVLHFWGHPAAVAHFAKALS